MISFIKNKPNLLIKVGLIFLLESYFSKDKIYTLTQIVVTTPIRAKSMPSAVF